MARFRKARISLLAYYADWARRLILHPYIFTGARWMDNRGPIIQKLEAEELD